MVKESESLFKKIISTVIASIFLALFYYFSGLRPDGTTDKLSVVGEEDNNRKAEILNSDNIYIQGDYVVNNSKSSNVSNPSVQREEINTDPTVLKDKSNADFEGKGKTTFIESSIPEEHSIITITITIKDNESNQYITNAELSIEGSTYIYYSDEYGRININVSSLRQKYGEFGSVNTSIYHPNYRDENFVLGLSESQTLKLSLK